MLLFELEVVVALTKSFRSRLKNTVYVMFQLLVVHASFVQLCLPSIQIQEEAVTITINKYRQVAGNGRESRTSRRDGREDRSLAYAFYMFLVFPLWPLKQEEVVTITMNKYRKSQAMIEEAEHRAEMAERTVSVTRGGGSGRNRSMSVTREITRVVRV